MTRSGPGKSNPQQATSERTERAERRDSSSNMAAMAAASLANIGNTPAENINSVANQVFRLALFDHLPRKPTPKDPDSIESERFLHASTVQLGLMYNRGVVQSDDDRVQALIAAFKCMIADYKTPPKKILREDLDRYIGKQVTFLY